MELREYQKEALDVTLRKFEKTDTALAVMATGLGKTIYFAHLARRFLQHGRIMVLAHWAELIYQNKQKLETICETKASIEMGDQWASEGFYKSDIVLSTIQSQIAGRDGGQI